MEWYSILLVVLLGSLGYVLLGSVVAAVVAAHDGHADADMIIVIGMFWPVFVVLVGSVLVASWLFWKLATRLNPKVEVK